MKHVLRKIKTFLGLEKNKAEKVNRQEVKNLKKEVVDEEQE